MPQLVLHHLQIHARLQGEAGGPVPQVVQPDRRKTTISDQLAEVIDNRSGVIGRPPTLVNT